MNILINGKNEILQSSYLYDLISERGLSHNTVVIELNRKVVKRAEWKDVVLKENDEIEILNFVGGG